MTVFVKGAIPPTSALVEPTASHAPKENTKMLSVMRYVDPVQQENTLRQRVWTIFPIVCHVANILGRFLEVKMSRIVLAKLVMWG